MAGNQTFAIASYCSSRAWGGLEMNVLRFTRWMRERGWEAFLYARADSELFWRGKEADMPVRSMACDSKISSLWHAHRLARLTRVDAVRFLVFHQSRDLLISVLAKLCLARKLGLVYCQHMQLGGDKKDLLHNWQYRHIDALISPAPWLAAGVRRHTVLKDSAIHMVPHGIEVDRFVIKTAKHEARKRLGLPQDAAIVGLVGRLDPKKGQHIAVKALRHVHDSGHRAHLLVVGAETLHEQTGYAEYLGSLVKDLDLSEFVHFRPHLEQPEAAYSAIDVFALTSECESYGMVTVEAMCSGLPVIGSNDGGTVDLIDHERTGLLFRPNDHVDLASSIARYLHDPEFARQMALVGQREAIERFSHARQMDAWEKLLIDLTRDTHRGFT